MNEEINFNCKTDYDKLLNYIKTIALIMFPNSKQAQQEVVLVLLAHVSDKQNFDYTGIIEALGGYNALADCRSYNELCKLFLRKEKEWMTVYRTMKNFEKINLNSDVKIRKMASLNKAFYLTGSMIENQEEDMPSNVVRLKRIWEDYKPVAHLIYAYCSFRVSRRSEDAENILTCLWGDINRIFIKAYDIENTMKNFKLPIVNKPVFASGVLYPIDYESLSKDCMDIEFGMDEFSCGKTLDEEERKALFKYRVVK